MGTVIYPSSELLVTDHAELTTGEACFPADHAKKAAEAIAGMKDRWGNPIFKRDGYVLEFAAEKIEGCDPVKDYIETPIKQAIEIAKQNGAYIEGYVDITSDWNDYDNIHIDVSEEGITYTNSEITNASDDELIAELKKRGYSIVKKEEI